MLKQQHGASFITWLIMLAFVGLVLTIGLRLLPVYLNAYTVQSIVREVASEAQGAARSPVELWSSIQRRLDINDVDNVTQENFVYEKDKGAATIGVKYETRTPLIGNLDGVARFDISEPLAQSSDE